MSRYATHADDVLGYTYRADIYCAACIVGQLTTNPGAVGTSGVEQGMAEKHLDSLARIRGIDRRDESSYDSDEFPKVIFAADVQGDDVCYSCDMPLYGDADDAPHDCGLCDGPLVLDGHDPHGHRLWSCSRCEWRHTSDRCCD